MACANMNWIRPAQDEVILQAPRKRKWTVGSLKDETFNWGNIISQTRKLLHGLVCYYPNADTDSQFEILFFPYAMNCYIKNSVAWVRERIIPTERPPLVGEVSANFCGWVVPRGQRDGSLRSYSRFSRPEPLLFLPSSTSVVLRDWVDPVLDPLLLRKSGRKLKSKDTTDQVFFFFFKFQKFLSYQIRFSNRRNNIFRGSFHTEESSCTIRISKP
jgi:hypothetical protein